MSKLHVQDVLQLLQAGLGAPAQKSSLKKKKKTHRMHHPFILSLVMRASAAVEHA
jgi:hypothetical protein